MLHQHSEIAAPPESGFAHWWHPKYKDWSESDNNNHNKIEKFVRDISISKKIETWELNFDHLLELITKERPENYASLISLVYMSYKKGNNVRAIIDKNNYYINHLEDLPLVWPDATYIHLVRDGRDVACSYLDIEKLNSTSKYKPQLSTNLLDIAREWSQNNKKIKLFGEQISTKILTIRYEDLVKYPKETLDSTCSFLNLPFDKKMLSYYQKHSKELTEPLATLDWKIKTKEKPDISRIYRYQRHLTKQQIESFNGEAHEMLSYYKYKV